MEDPERPTPLDPPTIRDTVEIRPLRKWVSRLFITAALILAGWLAVYASLMIRTMSSDPQIRARLETMERARDSTAIRIRQGESDVPPVLADSVDTGTGDAVRDGSDVSAGSDGMNVGADSDGMNVGAGSDGMNVGADSDGMNVGADSTQ